MRYRGYVVGACVLAATVATARAEPKPVPVDIKAYRDQLIVLQDVKGGTYAVVYAGGDSHVFYGAGKSLYEQVHVGASSDGDAWSVDTWEPRLAQMRPGSIDHLKDGTYKRSCDGKDDMVLTQVTGEKARQILAKDAFLTTANIHRPHLLARDDGGVYYYVDNLARDYGGKGYRVFVGHKGAMQQVPLDEVASDSAGDVFATKRGELRLVTPKGGSEQAVWIKGDKRNDLVMLDLDINSPLIYRELGIYSFIGSLCENL